MAVYDPSRYNEVPTRELLEAAALGFIGVDRRVVQALLDRGPEAAADVIAFAKADDEKHRIDISQLVVDLLRHWKPEGALDVYINVIRRNPEDLGDELIEALLPFREQAVEPLLELYEELGEEAGSDVAFLLAGLHVRDARILELLLDRLQYDAADGAFCLGLYGDVSARPALEKMLGEIASAPKSNDPDDDTTVLQREIRYALDQLGGPEPDYTPEPFDIFKEYPKTDIPALDLMTEEERIEMLASPDAETRGAAAHTFFNHELSETAKRELSRLAESDPEPKVRGYAWASLADVTEDKALNAKMVAVVNDRSRDIAERGGAAVGLYGVADTSPAKEAIESLYQEGGKARAKALEAMWRSLWKPFSKYFAENLGDPDPAIVRQALRGAGYFQLTSQVEKIASYFNRDEPFDDLREDALFAYALAMPGETTRGRMPGMLRKIDDIAQLNSEEMNVVKFALDERLRMAGKQPVFEEDEHDHAHHDHDHDHHDHNHHGHDHSHAAAQAPQPTTAKVGRNDPCPCGSGKKYKKCHGA